MCALMQYTGTNKTVSWNLWKTSLKSTLVLLTFKISLSTCLKLLGLCYCLQEFLNYYTVIVSCITVPGVWIKLDLKQLYAAYKIQPPKQPLCQLTKQECQKNSETVEVRIKLDTNTLLKVTFLIIKTNQSLCRHSWISSTVLGSSKTVVKCVINSLN